MRVQRSLRSRVVSTSTLVVATLFLILIVTNSSVAVALAVSSSTMQRPAPCCMAQQRLQALLAARDTRSQPRPIRNASRQDAAADLTLLASPLTAKAEQLPIILYHATPEDFASQLQVLRDRDYTTVTLQQVETAWHGGTALPNKPVVLTFDDGLESQMKAFALLKQFKMKATFYIINGGEASNWCIGASRRYNDPSQPAGGCGDAYLSWGQIRQLDQSGLITIGGHTLNHLELPKQSVDVQRTEITVSKAGIEHEIGHPIEDFAYPYGEYDQTTEDLVRQAGYLDAVTTNNGTDQDTSKPFEFERIRDTYELP